jgi:hypothetical protein
MMILKAQAAVNDQGDGEQEEGLVREGTPLARMNARDIPSPRITSEAGNKDGETDDKNSTRDKRKMSKGHSDKPPNKIDYLTC